MLIIVMNEQEICLMCLIGLPAAGKTYLSSLILRNNLDLGQVKHVCYDSLISWQETGIVWRDQRRTVLNYVENYIVKFKVNNPNLSNLLVILDDNMYYQSMRYEFYKLSRKLGIKFCQVYVDTPIDICLERNQKRVHPIPSHHILNMNEKLEKPLINNEWEKDTLHLHHTMSDSECIYLIKTLLISSRVPKVIEENKKLSVVQSTKHTADLALRKIITQITKELKCSGRKDIAEQVAALRRRRQDILDRIRKGELHLPEEENIQVYVNYLIKLFHISEEILGRK